ncbi:MAG: hypothetical protein AAF215_35560 [Cyanobacteria bacterium P01_A01_bin.123]
MTLTLDLPPELERYLLQEAKQQGISIEDMTLQLLKASFALRRKQSEDTAQTVLERMGGMPQHLLSVGDLSDRETRRKLVAERIQARYRAQS